MAEIIPFPLAARRDLVGRQAQWFLGQGASAAERNLSAQLKLQRGTLLNRGVSAFRVETEIAALHFAIRDEIARLSQARGGRA